MSYLEKRKGGRRLGQHFLIDEEVVGKLVNHVARLKPELVVEVGAGFGFITERLSKVAGRVLAVEKDREIFEMASKRLDHLSNVDIICEDVLHVTIPVESVVTGAPPYSISTSLIKKILDSKVGDSVLILQREFAQRIAAREGESEYSYLSALIGVFGSVELLEAIGRESFYPPPMVDSRIVGIRLYRNLDVPSEEIEGLTRFIAELFKRHRRRKVKNALAALGRGEAQAWVRGVLEKRVFELKPSELLQFYEGLAKSS